MKYGYKEIRKIDARAIRSLCVRNDWFTLGDNSDYETLLNYGFSDREITTDEIVEMAEIIKEYSDTDMEITSIMFELGRICTTVFVEI